MNVICEIQPDGPVLWDFDPEGSKEVARARWSQIELTRKLEEYHGDESWVTNVDDLPKDYRKEILRTDLKWWAEGLGHTITEYI